MPFDEDGDHGGDDHHEDLPAFAEILIKGMKLNAEINEKCFFCTSPHVLHQLVLYMFLSGNKAGMPMDDTMEMVEAAASLARVIAIEKIRDQKKARG